MVLLLFSVICFFYLGFGLLYLADNSLIPLGAMSMPGVPTEVVEVFMVGYISVVVGYILTMSRKPPKMKTISTPYFMRFSSYLYSIISFGMFLPGVMLYGGYLAFLRTPYSAIIDISDNQVRDVLISSSGLISVFAVLASLSGSGSNKLKGIVFSVNAFILLSIFVQGRRETTMLLLVTFFAYKFVKDGMKIKSLLKALTIGIVIAGAAGAGLYLRSSSATSGGSILTAINYAVLYETHFTIATLGNEIRSHFTDGQPYQGVLNLFQPILFVVPSVFFYMLGLDKKVALGIMTSEPKLYDDKGGSFLFTQAVHSLGYTGVIIDGLAIGFLLAYFYKIARDKGMIFFYFPIVSIILVAIRKDVTYGVKYISLQFMILFCIYLVYILLPKKR